MLLLVNPLKKIFKSDKDYQKTNKKFYVVLLLPVLGILQSSHNKLQSSPETLIILGNNCWTFLFSFSSRYNVQAVFKVSESNDWDVKHLASSEVRIIILYCTQRLKKEGHFNPEILHPYKNIAKNPICHSLFIFTAA